MAMTITQALLLFAEHAPMYTDQCFELIRHIEIGDKELFSEKARSFLSSRMDEAEGIPEDDKQAIREAIEQDGDQELIPIKEYAAMHGVDASTIRHRIMRGVMPGAVMMAGSWFVPRDLPLTDNRRGGRSKRWKENQE